MNNSAGSSSEFVDNTHAEQEGGAGQKETPLRELLGNPKITFVLGKYKNRQLL